MCLSSVVETLYIWQKKILKKWHNDVIIDAYKPIICAELSSKDITEAVVAKMLDKVSSDVFPCSVLFSCTHTHKHNGVCTSNKQLKKSAPGPSHELFS